MGLTMNHIGTANTQTRIIRSDAEALQVAAKLAASFEREASERDRTRTLPAAQVAAFYGAGLGAATVPRRFGGAEISAVTLAEMFAVIAAADPSIGQIPQNHTAFLELLRYSHDEPQQRHYFGLALSGASFGNALAERFGKTTREISTRVTRRGEGYVLNGQKFYATGALFSSYVPIGAVDEEGRIYRVIVPREAAGLKITDDWSGMGQRTTASGTVTLENVAVPVSAVVKVHEFAAAPSLYGPVSQLIQAAIDLGIARAAIAATVSFVKSHARPWMDSGKDRAADDPFIISNIGELEINLHAAEAMLARAGETIDAGRRQLDVAAQYAASIAVAEAKVFTTEIALAATNKLFELGGTRAAMDELNLHRHWRNARTHTLHDPVRWKFYAVGNYHLNGAAPPKHAWI
jgi:SfnB family sulfur acquisition oxidoreductase